MPSAAVTVLVADPPLICPTEGTDVQATIRALRPYAGGGDALPEGGSNLGRAYWLGPRPGQKLAVDGIRMLVAVRRACSKPRLAVHPRYHHAVGGGSRSSRSGAGGRASESLLPADRSANRVSPRALHRRRARLADRRHRAAARLAPCLRLYH